VRGFMNSQTTLARQNELVEIILNRLIHAVLDYHDRMRGLMFLSRDIYLAQTSIFLLILTKFLKYWQYRGWRREQRCWS